MDKPKSLDKLFTGRMFRIPDYQRGYAWRKEHLQAFWEDLINLPPNRSHYTGVLTLKEYDQGDENADEHWLVEDHSYKMYHVVDGQQRLTTFVVFIQALIEFIRTLDENSGKNDKDIYITDSLNLVDITENYLFKENPRKSYRTYKFGYTVDNPSYKYLRYKILGENTVDPVQETFYTLNLKNAKKYFSGQLQDFYSDLDGLRDIYKRITKRFFFNEYVIEDDFDVFVAFETMNNRGKNLSNLELLKNRLIYLTSIYSDDDFEHPADRSSLRESINDAWKEIYHQLGRNDKRPLNDDEFLRAHWIMYFGYRKRKGDDYIDFLLNRKFSLENVYKKVEREVELDLPEEQVVDTDADESENENDDYYEPPVVKTADLPPTEIKDYANSLKESAVHWFNLHYPNRANGLSSEEIYAVDRLNRYGTTHLLSFRPLMMSFFKNERLTAARLELMEEIERFIFVGFYLCRHRHTYRESTFWNAARDFNRNELILNDIKEIIEKSMQNWFHEDGLFNPRKFHQYLYDKFDKDGPGYFVWDGLRYFLYEYELHLLEQSRQEKVSWESLKKTSQDRVSIEHILPQKPTGTWKEELAPIPTDRISHYTNSIGNLLVLSMSINSSLQNDSFNAKKNPKYSAGKKVRNGYSDGSHSEIEVAQCDKWGAEEIEARGLRLLTFMEKRWGIKFREQDKERLLFLDPEEDESATD